MRYSSNIHYYISDLILSRVIDIYSLLKTIKCSFPFLLVSLQICRINHPEIAMLACFDLIRRLIKRPRKGKTRITSLRNRSKAFTGKNNLFVIFLSYK